MYNTEYDFCIYGGTAAAFAAAYKLRSRKKKVLLITPNGYLCGESGNAFLTTLKSGISSVADELIADLKNAGDGYNAPYADPCVLQIRILDLLKEIDILFYTRPAGIISGGSRFLGIHVAAKDGISNIRASCFIDASDDLELMRYAHPEQCITPENPDSVFLFSMMLDDDADLPEKVNSDLHISRSVWSNERTFSLRNGKRTDLRKLIPALRSAYPDLASALLFRASNSPVPLAVTSFDGAPKYGNLFALSNRKAFTFEDHAGLLAERMKEGERLAEQAEAALANFPPLVLLPQEKVLASEMNEVNCDILVCGGGTAGAVAAIAAARKGKDVVVWENMDYLGGIGTGGAIPAYYYGLPGGLQDEIDRKVKELSAVFFGRHQLSERYNHYFHPLAKMVVLEEMLAEAGVRVEFGKTICSVETARVKQSLFPVLRGAAQPMVMNKLNAVEAASAAGLVRCRAKTFIDSTGDGDVAVFAGAVFSAGREPDAVQHIFSIPSLMLNPETDRDENGNEVRSYFRIFPFNIDAGYVDANDNWDISRARRRGILGFDRPKYVEDFHLVYISAVVGARASRRIRGDYEIGLGDQIRASEFPDVIAYSASHYDNHAQDFENESLNALIWSWALDSHSEPIGCEIPYRVMLPYGIENLIVACRAISTDFDASQQFRMQRDMQRLGEAAGLAAAVAVEDNVMPRYINIRKVQRDLAGTNALMEPESNYHCDRWQPKNFYPDRRTFELTEKGFAPSRNLLPASVSAFNQLEADLKNADPAIRYYAAVKLAAGAKTMRAEEELIECIRSRCADSPADRRCKVPLWKIAVAICGANKYEDARKVIEDILADENSLGDQQALILAIRALGEIGNSYSAKMIDQLLRRGDLAHTQEFFYWSNDKTITDDTTWKIELAGFEAMYKLGLEKREFLEPYFDDERGYVRRAAERVRLRAYGK